MFDDVTKECGWCHIFLVRNVHMSTFYICLTFFIFVCKLININGLNYVMDMKTITNPKERLVDQHGILVYYMICLYEAELKENYRFGESQVFCLWWTMTTLQATPPTEQLVIELGLLLYEPSSDEASAATQKFWVHMEWENNDNAMLRVNVCHFLSRMQVFSPNFQHLFPR